MEVPMLTIYNFIIAYDLGRQTESLTDIATFGFL